MKTSKPMQLRILEKMRENVESDIFIMSDIEFFAYGRWKHDMVVELLFDDYEYRIKPETITINGVEIPKPLGGEFQELARDTVLYIPSAFGNWNIGRTVADLCSNYFPQATLIYKTEEEAIEASKLLFGIKD